MGLKDLVGKLFGGKPAPKAEPSFARGEAEGEIVHRHSGFRFPGAVADFRIMGANQYDERGLDVSVGYNQAGLLGAAMTVYVYPCSGEPGEALRRQFESCKGDVTGVHQKADVLSEGTARIAPGGASREGLRAVFRLEDDLGGARVAVVSELWLFVHKGFFVKYRVSYAEHAQDEAPAVVSAFLDGLVWPA